VEEFPLALAYRNLAVYWNSEAIPSGNEYTEKHSPRDPKDPFNHRLPPRFSMATR